MWLHPQILSRLGLILAVAILVVSANDAAAQAPSCAEPVLGSGACLPWGLTELSSTISFPITDISSDGSVVAGSENGVVYRWKRGVGEQALTLPGEQKLSINRRVISADGSVIVGETTSTGAMPTEIFRWDTEAPSTELLQPGPANAVSTVFPGFLNGTVYPLSAPSVSADGDSVLSSGYMIGGSGNPQYALWPALWTASSGTTDDPQLSFYDPFFALGGIAGDGISIAGVRWVGITPGNYQAHRWRPTGIDDLGVPIPAETTAISYDGSFIAGNYEGAGGTTLTFLWEEGAGYTQIGQDFFANAISDDGNIVVGLNPNLPTPAPMVWSGIGPPLNLRSYLGVLFGIQLPPFPPNPGVSVSGAGDAFVVNGGQWVAKATPINAVVLGDSFSSGEGVIPFDPATDIPGINECHRSSKAYSQLFTLPSSSRPLAEIAANAATTPGFSLDFLACSGATTADLLTDGRWDEGPQLNHSSLNNDTDLVILSIGGNDAHFEPIAKRCGIPLIDCMNWVGTNPLYTLREEAFEHIRTVVSPALLEAFNTAKLRAPNATVLALAYPDVIGTKSCWGFLSGLTDDEIKFVRKLGRALNQTIAGAAKSAGIHFVSTIWRRSLGSGACSSSPTRWINGVVLHESVYSLHPNSIGQRAYAREISAYLDSLDVESQYDFFPSGMPENPTPQ